MKLGGAIFFHFKMRLKNDLGIVSTFLRGISLNYANKGRRR